MIEGPQTEVSEQTHRDKYRQIGETFREAMTRVSHTLSDDTDHFYQFRNILLPMRYLPAGRVQSDIGSPSSTTAFNCFVSESIEDSMIGIMRSATDGALTMRTGGGIGYDFSPIRPRGDIIVSLNSKSSGPVSFMQIHDAVCKTVSSAGDRRGAQMGVLRIDHPSIEEFIEAKGNTTELTQFNISVAITDKFMEALLNDGDFELTFEGKVYKRVRAKYLWDKIMRSTWDWAEPGVLFIDRINERNNLNYCETISATNPCGEQPLPPNGACLLGSFNLVKYLVEGKQGLRFDYKQFREDIPCVVRAMDNVIDCTNYPLPQQEDEAKSKRRIGLGVTALANAGEALGLPYASKEFLSFQRKVQSTLINECYRASAVLANEKGSFPAYKAEEYAKGYTLNNILSDDVAQLVKECGLRNSHLTSIAPTGTISLTADNVSSGIEPVFAPAYERTIKRDGGTVTVVVEDYGLKHFGTKAKTASECTIDEHLAVLTEASRWVDSAVSKTINVGDAVSWEDFKGIYINAWKSGCKGCTTFRAAGKRYGILNVLENKNEGACYIDTATGKKQCE